MKLRRTETERIGAERLVPQRGDDRIGFIVFPAPYLGADSEHRREYVRLQYGRLHGRTRRHRKLARDILAYDTVPVYL